MLYYSGISIVIEMFLLYCLSSVEMIPWMTSLAYHFVCGRGSQFAGIGELLDSTVRV